jgi:hypothetical protein
VSTQVIVYLLTALAAVVVVLTRLRLARENAVAGRLQVGRRLLDLHSVAGALAVVTWLAFLVAGEDTALGGAATGIIALAFWWIVAAVGLMILVRWMPAGGKHASAVIEDSWSQGPGLSVLAHVGMLVGVVVFTWAYLIAAV